MKKIYYLIITIAIIILSGCSNDSEQFNDIANTLPSRNNHTVNYSDLQKLLNAQNPKSRAGSNASLEIKCLCNNSNDTMLYVYEKSDGWTMYSSDTRVPAIVAHSDEGTFTEAMKNESLALWVQSMIEDMKAIREASDQELKFTAKEIENNKRFWEAISHPEKVIAFNGSRVREPTEHLTGHYELRHSEEYEEVYDSIPRMTTTNWHQEDPYNSYCPYQEEGSERRCAAGCGPIAVAQMLYYLHYKIGVPETAPSQAYCHSYAGSSTYYGNQYNFTSTIWDYMYIKRNTAPLIAHIGRTMNTNYSTQSSVSFRVFRNTFANYGINCNECDFNPTTLKNALMENMPVLITAHSNRSSSRSLDDSFNDRNGHAFIIDSYKRHRTITKNYYEWVNDITDPSVIVPCMPTRIEYVVSSPYIAKIAMNWGWNGYRNDIWFSILGDWIHPQDGDHNNWTIDRRMLYNFTPIN